MVDADGKPSFPGVLWSRRACLREPRGARVREGARLLRHPLGVRAADVRARGGRGRARGGGVHARLLPARAGPLPRDHDDEAVARDSEEPQAAEVPGAVSGGPDQALLQARRRATGRAIPPRARLLTAPDSPVGEVYLTAEDIAARVHELAAEIAADYADRDPPRVARGRDAPRPAVPPPRGRAAGPLRRLHRARRALRRLRLRSRRAVSEPSRLARSPVELRLG